MEYDIDKLSALIDELQESDTFFDYKDLAIIAADLAIELRTYKARHG